MLMNNDINIFHKIDLLVDPQNLQDELNILCR